MQILPTSKYGKPPFKTDNAFIRAIKRLLTEVEVKSYMEGLELAPNGLLRKRDLKRLYEYYLEESGGKSKRAQPIVHPRPLSVSSV